LPRSPKTQQGIGHRLAATEGLCRGVLLAISGEVEKLYTKLHPGEGIGKIRFYLKPNAIGSLEFDAQFQTAPEIPRRRITASRTSTRSAFACFLALAKYFMTDNTIVVLDDVVTSVDGPHLDRFMQLLARQATNFQSGDCDYPLSSVGKTAIEPRADRRAKTQVIELRLWSLQWGVQADEAVTAIKELRACLHRSENGSSAVASKSCIQLESVLDFLTFPLRLQDGPAGRSNYTLGALAMGIDFQTWQAVENAPSRCCRTTERRNLAQGR